MSRKLPLADGETARTACARILIRSGVDEKTGEVLPASVLVERVGWCVGLTSGMVGSVLGEHWSTADVNTLMARAMPGGPEPVVVAGAGPVGMVAALLLARCGVRSVVLEEQPERVAVGSRSICVQRDVLDILERAGVGSAVAEAGVTWTRGRTYFREHQVLEITFPEFGDSAFPPFVNTPQSIVELLLEDRIAREPLVELRRGQRVVAVEQDDTGVTVSTSDTSNTLDTSDGPVRGTHLVAADGQRSAVRESLGVPFPGVSYSDKFLIADIRAELGFTVPERRFFFDPAWNPGRQVLLHPQPGGVWRIDWQVPEDFDLERERAGGGLDERIRAVVGDAGYEIVWLSVYRFHQRRAPTMRIGRVLLAGDAAHVMSPFGARGLNSGVSDADNAVWKIVLDRSGLGGPALLESYDAERGAAAGENLRVTGETMRFLVPQNDADRARRIDVLTRAVTDEDARAEIDSGRLYEPYRYVDSPLTTRREYLPTGAPPPGSPCPDARLDLGMRLRELVGPRFAVLTNWCPWRPADEWERELTGRPVELDQFDGDAVLASALRLPPRSLVIVRPDGHIAAMLVEPRPPGQIAPLVTEALRRATGWSAT